MTKSVHLIAEYHKERRKLQCLNFNNEMLDIMDAIVEDYKAHVGMNLALERVVHDTVKADEKGRK